MTNSQGCCHLGKILVAVIVFAFALQLFFCLMAVAVATGNGYLPIVAFSHMFCWPIYFICLGLSFLLAVFKCIKHYVKHCSDDSANCCADK